MFMPKPLHTPSGQQVPDFGQSISGQPGDAAYPASKFAVNGLTLSLVRKLGSSNIRVNAAAPGITRTDMAAVLSKEVIESMMAPIPLRRIGKPEDVANAFCSLPVTLQAV